MWISLPTLYSTFSYGEKFMERSTERIGLTRRLTAFLKGQPAKSESTTESHTKRKSQTTTESKPKSLNSGVK